MCKVRDPVLDALLLPLEQQDVPIDVGLVRVDGVIVGIQVYTPKKEFLLLMI